MAGGAGTRKGQASGEAVIASAFAARGVPSCPYSEWQKRPPAIPHVLVLGWPFVTLYQTQGHVEFVLVSAGRPTVTVEIKHQNVSGSCDEKLPYVLLNAVYQWPSPHGILVLSGSHWASPRGLAATSAMQRLAALAAPANRVFDVFDMTRATNWIARTF